MYQAYDRDVTVINTDEKVMGDVGLVTGWWVGDQDGSADSVQHLTPVEFDERYWEGLRDCG